MKLIPAMRGGIGAYMLTAKGYDDIKRNAAQLEEVMSGKLDPTTAGLKRQSETLEGSLSRLNGTISAIANEEGPGFIDFLTKA